MKSVIFICLLCIVLAEKYNVGSFPCTESGYADYLAAYRDKCGDECNPGDEYFETHFGSWKSSCLFMRARDSYTPYDMQFSYLSDYDEATIEELMDIDPSYRGTGSYCPPPLNVNSSSYLVDTSLYPKRDFCDASSYADYKKPSGCTTSWANEAIIIAERVLKDEGHDVRLSVDYLFKCVPESVSRNYTGCNGFLNKDIFDFIATNGLISEADAATLEDICKPPESMLYTFIVKDIECPNKGNLMNMIAEYHHVDVMIALDLKKLRFVSEMDKDDGAFLGASMQPTMWATVVGYTETEDEEPVWYMESSVVPCERIQFKMPLRDNETSSNYAGIAGYAYSLVLEDVPAELTEVPTSEVPTSEVPTSEVPTTSPTEPAGTTEPPTAMPTTEPPTTEPPTPEPTTAVPTPAPYTVEITGTDCLDKYSAVNIPDSNVTDLYFYGKCTDITVLNLENFKSLQRLHIGSAETAPNALSALTSLTIKNLPFFHEFIVYDGNGAQGSGTVMSCTQDTFVDISDNPALTTIVFGLRSFNSFCELKIENNDELKLLSFASADNLSPENDDAWLVSSSFNAPTKVIIANNGNLENMIVAGGTFQFFREFTLDGLPKLENIYIGDYGLVGYHSNQQSYGVFTMKGVSPLLTLQNRNGNTFGWAFTSVKNLFVENCQANPTGIVLRDTAFADTVKTGGTYTIDDKSDGFKTWFDANVLPHATNP